MLVKARNEMCRPTDYKAVQIIARDAFAEEVCMSIAFNCLPDCDPQFNRLIGVRARFTYLAREKWGLQTSAKRSAKKMDIFNIINSI